MLFLVFAATVYAGVSVLILRDMMAQTAALTQAVSDVQASINTAIALLQQLKAGQANPADQTAIDSAVSGLQSAKSSLDAAVAANQP